MVFGTLSHGQRPGSQYTATEHGRQREWKGLLERFHSSQGRKKRIQSCQDEKNPCGYFIYATLPRTGPSWSKAAVAKRQESTKKVDKSLEKLNDTRVQKVVVLVKPFGRCENTIKRVQVVRCVVDRSISSIAKDQPTKR